MVEDSAPQSMDLGSIPLSSRVEGFKDAIPRLSAWRLAMEII